MLTIVSIVGLQLSIFSQSPIQRYYKCINSAEKCLIEDKLDSTLYYYGKAAEYRPIMFAKDLHNAAVVAIQQGTPNLASQYLSSLIKLGAALEVLRENSFFNTYFGTEHGKKWIEESHRIKPTYNVAYREQLKAMELKDQYYRKKRGGSNQYADSIRLADTENVAELRELIKTKGFPTEETVGIDPKSYTIPFVTTIIIHQNNGPNQQYNFAPILYQQVVDGKLHNSLGYDLWAGNNGGAYQLDFMRFVLIKVIDSTKPPRRTNYIALDSTDYGFAPFGDEAVTKINSGRRLFYLDDYDLYTKKILFNRRFSQYLLTSIYSGTSIFYTDRAGFEKDRGKLISSF